MLRAQATPRLAVERLDEPFAGRVTSLSLGNKSHYAAAAKVTNDFTVGARFRLYTTPGSREWAWGSLDESKKNNGCCCGAWATANPNLHAPDYCPEWGA